MRVVCIALGLCGAASLVCAQVPDSLRACAAQSDSARRLACYDKEMARGAPSAPAHDSVASSASSAPKVPAPEEFGLSKERARAKQGKAERQELTAHVTSVTQLQNGRERIALDNDQIWEQTEDDWGFNPQSGATATITSGVLGGFWMATDAYRKVRVKRIR
jgi:hypothetical protein